MQLSISSANILQQSQELIYSEKKIIFPNALMQWVCNKSTFEVTYVQVTSRQDYIFYELKNLSVRILYILTLKYNRSKISETESLCKPSTRLSSLSHQQKWELFNLLSFQLPLRPDKLEYLWKCRMSANLKLHHFIDGMKILWEIHANLVSIQPDATNLVLVMH